MDIIPHRARMKQGFEVGAQRVDVETAFKNTASRSSHTPTCFPSASTVSGAMHDA